VNVWPALVGGFTGTLRRDSGAGDATYELMAHEACHALARAQGLTWDPCHAEDHGFVRVP
jgi:hypothetical protein